MRLNDHKTTFLSQSVQVFSGTPNGFLLESCDTILSLSTQQAQSLFSIFPFLKKNKQELNRLRAGQKKSFWAEKIFFLDAEYHINLHVSKEEKLLVFILEDVSRTLTKYILPADNYELEAKGSEASELEQLKKLQKLRQDHFSKITHDIKLPLTEIIGTTYLLQQFVETDKGKSYLQALNNAARSLDTMLNDLVSFSKNESLSLKINKQPFSLQQVIESVIKSFEFKVEQQAVPILLEMSEEVPELLVGDATRLSQIVYNLLDNALKYTNKGNVNVRVWCVPKADILSKEKNVCPLQFEVSDTGVGIPPNRLQAIFETYEQARKEDEQTGFGIGLSIVKQLVELQGGTISAESEIQKGSTFRFSLNFYRQPAKSV